MSNYLIAHLLDRHTGSQKPFLSLDDGRKVSYGAFDQRVNQIANLLVDNGLQPGDRVAVQTGKSWQSLALYLATIKAGGVFLPLNTAYTSHEVSYFVDNAEPRFLVCDTKAATALTPVANGAASSILELNDDGSGPLADRANDCSTSFEAVPRKADDLAAILYTSGTTGRSKGAMLSHANLWSNAEVLSAHWQFSEDDVLLHALPVFHTHGLFVATNVCMAVGASMIFLSGFQQDSVLKALPQATSMMGVPTFYTRLLGDERFNKALVEHMRLFVSGSAPLLSETHVEFESRTGHRILERYGMTETNMNTSNPYSGERRAGTVGPALPGTIVRVTSADTGAEIGVNEIGSIEVSGPNVFGGYWRMPEKTAEEFTTDGFFITGDLGTLSDDGYLTIVGRGKDLIISGGYNIYPKEIELILDDIQGVTESAVIGVPHPDFGEGVVAVLVGDNIPATSQIQQWVSDKLARFKQPKQIYSLDELPRNTMGKVQKNLLREQFKNSFQT